MPRPPPPEDHSTETFREEAFFLPLLLYEAYPHLLKSQHNFDFLTEVDANLSVVMFAIESCKFITHNVSLCRFFSLGDTFF